MHKESGKKAKVTAGGETCASAYSPHLSKDSNGAGTHPNILVILTDQQSAGMMSCTGNPDLDTPAMDWLANNGVRFDRAYAANPVCLPSRFSLQTGCYPGRVAVRSNQDGKHARPFPDFERNTLGHRMCSAGYNSVYGGKVHLPSGCGMDDVRNLGYEVISQDQREALAQECASFIRRDHHKPFFLFASFINPHDICYMAINDYNRACGKPLRDNLAARICEETLAQAPTDEHELPPVAGIRAPESFGVSRNEPKAIEEFLKQRPFKHHSRYQWDEKTWRMHHWVYCRLTERVDRQIGMLLDALEETGQLEDTLIVFTSDHGDIDGAHRMEHKTAFYEQSVRVPLTITQKGSVTPQVDNQHIVNNGLDLFPTLCDYAGIAPPPSLLGASLRPLIEDRNDSAGWRKNCMIESEIGNYLVLRDWKYCRLDFAGTEEALFNLVEDPYEMKNLAIDQEHQSKLVELRKELAAWEEATTVNSKQ